LTYLFYELTRHPEWQEQIRNESAGCEWKDVSNSPILEGVIKEALRLHAAAPASLWREVPDGGLVLSGYYIPEKVRNDPRAY